MRLDQIKPIHIVNFLSQLKKADGSPMAVSTAQYVYRVLRNILQRAADWKIIKSNPAADVSKPSQRGIIEKEINVYDENEVAVLFDAVQDEPIHWRVFTSLALAAGLRRGELLGLEWSHIDLEKGIIQIKQIISRGTGGWPILKGPKSRNSKRVISLPPMMVEELKKYQIHWKKEKMRMRDLWIEHEHELVFCNENGKHYYPTNLLPGGDDLPTGLESDLSGYNLRHTSATLLINQGVHAKIISERLGHSKYPYNHGFIRSCFTNCSSRNS